MSEPTPDPRGRRHDEGGGLAALARRAIWLVGLAFLLGVGAVVTLLIAYFQEVDRPPVPVLGGRGDPVIATRSVVLFFPHAQADSLVAETRQILLPGNSSEMIRSLVAELERGPRAPALRRALPLGSRIRRVFFDESGGVYADFSAEINRGAHGGSTYEYFLLASLVRTICVNVPAVRTIVITVEGQPVPTLAGHFALDAPLLVEEWY